MGRFEGQVAIITGGALGIGGATARKLASEGASVFIADIDDAAAAANVKTIQQAGGTAAASHVDVSQSADIARMVNEAVDLYGRLDILVQNAFGVISGVSVIQGSALTVDEDGWDYGIDVLLKALYLGPKNAIPHMRATGGGNIINLASGWGMRGGRNNFMYSVAKGGIIQLTKALAMTYARDNIRCTCIAPGLIPKEIDLNLREQRNGFQPVGRVGWPREMGPLSVFLASDASAYMSGETVLLDGGSIAAGLLPAGYAPESEG